MRVGSRSLLFVLFAVTATRADPHVPLPQVNLGGSSFLDGLGGPGLLARESMIGYRSRRFLDSQGDPVPGTNHVTAVTSLTHLAWVSKHSFFGAHVGGEVILPITYVDLAAGGMTGSQVGIGDITVSPLLVQLPTLVGRQLRLFHKLDLPLTLPTGRYRALSLANAGTNVTSINPFYAFTVMFGRNVETSFRLHYLWNSENGDPAPAFGTRTARPGQAVHLNGAVSVAVSSTVRVGIAGYALQQITDARRDGAAVPGSRERVLGLGPGLLFGGRGLKLVANAYWEIAVVNRPSGVRAGLTVVNIW